MEILYLYLLIFIFAILYSKATLFWVYLWQLKEYRLDRFLAEFGFLGRLLRFWAFSGGRKFHRPVFTVKALLVYIASLIVILSGIYFISKGFFYGAISGFWLVLFSLLGLYFLVPFLVVLIMFLFQLPVVLIKNLIYKMASARVAGVKGLIVIGITGSYGKSSTKEFLAQILEKKFKVIRTPKNINTEIGISKFILQKLDPDDDIFIVEMGAYKKGEIKRICDIVKPKIGIITGINEQHLDLFGSFENIISTKFELIESLPEDGFALFNGENEYCVKMAENWGGNKFIYKSMSLEIKIPLSPPLEKGGAEGTIEWPFFYLENLSGAAEAAKYLGMGEDEISEAEKNIKLSERMLNNHIGKNGTLVIEDTYSANPAGVLAALDYLGQQKQKNKIVVMPCLIELGSAAEKVHREIGKKITEVCDLAIITTRDYFDILKSEAGEKVILAVKPEKVIELLKDRLNSDTAVLIEGRVADGVVEFVK